MTHFYTINGRKIKRYFFFFVIMLFAAAVFYSEQENITVFTNSEPSAIYSVVTNEKALALTFDISWGDKRVEPILEVLKDKKVDKATFFLSGPWSKSHPDLVQKIVEAGYEIGSHGHRHLNYSTLEDEDIRKQIQIAHQTLTQVTGKPPTLIRLPNGDFDKRVLRIANELNYKVIQWDTDSLDWKNIGTKEIVKRVTKKAHPGDIVLMHASDTVKQTHEALPIIIDELRSKGYKFVTVTELIQHTNVKDTPVRDNTPKR